VRVRIDEPRTGSRSTAHSFDIRPRSFCVMVAVKDPTGTSIPLLVPRAETGDREALLAIGHPFFRSTCRP